jgi:2-dehydro-3-deoxy-D-arabinonate dehydratase
MRIIRFVNQQSVPTLAALTDEEKVYALPQQDFMELVNVAEEQETTPLALVEGIIAASHPIDAKASDLKLIVPIEAPEVWASGVTYERSREARNYEATGGKLDALTCYDKVYDAVRPEIFFKSTAARTVGPNQDVYLRSDSAWQIPEPELGLVLSRSDCRIHHWK